MALTLGPILIDGGLDPFEVLVIRHAFTIERPGSGVVGIHADSTDDEILEYTRTQSVSTALFPATPARYWVVFVAEGGDRARLWSVVEQRGEVGRNDKIRWFDVAQTAHLAELRGRLVVGWRSPRTWRIHGTTAAPYSVKEIADLAPEAFPGFDRLIIGFPKLQAVLSERRYAPWRAALAVVIGVYLITDLRDGRQYVGKADGAEDILQRWSTYAFNGHGGNVELKPLDPATFQFSLLRVFDPSTPPSVVNAAESHFRDALGTRKFGLNGG
ncbi:GIY-YIG nuclease family protein [Plantibacter sp. M259]|uniref:GIY-YIG nuclease family protein n=1 Tax=Plantibacter sp. M259 TaxID=2583822 RepID=UPI00111009B0|nr:GIY-YIG nuclease family protein [Plantibacter sp. M259]